MEKLSFGGVTYRPLLQSTAEHDWWLYSRIHEMGLNKLEIGPDENPSDFATRIFYQVIGSGKGFVLLGGLLIPEHMQGHEWTPQLAAATAAKLAVITDDDEKQALNTAVASLLSGFFGRGLVSARISPGYSTTTAGSQPGSHRKEPGSAAPGPN